MTKVAHQYGDWPVGTCPTAQLCAALSVRTLGAHEPSLGCRARSWPTSSAPCRQESLCMLRAASTRAVLTAYSARRPLRGAVHEPHRRRAAL